jgi:hypothetical protein
MRSLNLPKLPQRFEEAVKTTANDLLFIFEGRDGYTETTHVRARVLLNALGTFGLIDRQDLLRYEKTYQGALLRHKDKIMIRFACDFREPEEYI